MKKLSIILLALVLFACKKDLQPESLSQGRTVSDPSGPALVGAHHVGDPNRTPNLYLPENEGGWLWDNPTFGLWVNNKRLEVRTDGSVNLAYDCVIANGIKNHTDFTFDPSGSKDFVVCESCDGITNGSGGYNYPGMLRIALFQNGELTGEVLKQTFQVEPNRELVNFPWSSYPHYSEVDTMYIYWGTGDNYFNHITVPSASGVANTGQYVVQVKVNPDGLITESNYDDNIGLLPINITSGNSVATDVSAISANVPKQITDLRATYNAKGKYKTVTLTWTSKAQEYCVQRDGVMIKKDIYSLTNTSGQQTYVDTVGGGFKGATYKILAENEGIGKTFSLPITVSSR